MDAKNQYVLVVRTVEDANPPAFGQTTRRTPEKVMFDFLGARLFETVNLAALGIHPGHNMADGPVFAGGVHSLENQQQRVAVGGIVQLL